jgi:hypothetical protein
MALQSLISRFATCTFTNPEIARNRAQATGFGQIDERRYIRSPISSRIEMGWQDERGWQTQSRVNTPSFLRRSVTKLGPALRRKAGECESISNM